MKVCTSFLIPIAGILESQVCHFPDCLLLSAIIILGEYCSFPDFAQLTKQSPIEQSLFFLLFTFYFCPMKIAIINGPNLNLLGTREPEIYGDKTFDDFLSLVKRKFPAVEFSYFQSNVEGELINELQRVGFSFIGIVLNPDR